METTLPPYYNPSDGGAEKSGCLPCLLPQTGDKVVLTWKFRGIGDVACKHDTVAVTCKSPYTLVVQNVDKTDTAHTFSVRAARSPWGIFGFRV